MKIKDLKNYGIPSSILNIWEKNPSPYLLPLQEDAVKNYGILSCVEGSTGLLRHFVSRNDKSENQQIFNYSLHITQLTDRLIARKEKIIC